MGRNIFNSRSRRKQNTRFVRLSGIREKLREEKGKGEILKTPPPNWPKIYSWERRKAMKERIVRRSAWPSSLAIIKKRSGLV